MSRQSFRALFDFLECGEVLGRGFHHVVAGAAVAIWETVGVIAANPAIRCIA